MSRSRKKHPIQQLATNKSMKKAFNRQLRWQNVDIGNNMEYKKHNDSYEICDWIEYNPDNSKIYRK